MTNILIKEGSDGEVHGISWHCWDMSPKFPTQNRLNLIKERNCPMRLCEFTSIGALFGKYHFLKIIIPNEG